MRKKLFLLIIFLTPCLSWAGKPKKFISGDRKPANLAASFCEQNDVKVKQTDSLYALSLKSQTGKIQSDLGEIIKKQGRCSSSN